MEIKEIESLRKSNRAAFNECHKVVEKNIIDLVKLFDSKESGRIVFSKPIVIDAGSKIDINNGHITTHIMMFDELKWNPLCDFFALKNSNAVDDVFTSTLLSVNNMFVVFDALVETISAY